MFKRLLAAVLLVGLMLSSTACIGRMAVSGVVRKFNLEVTESRWGREAVFLALMILPVYEFASLIDIIIVNSIEFWSGTNPVDGGERIAMVGDQRYARTPDGSEAISTLMADGSIDIEIHTADGNTHRVNLIREDGNVVARDFEGNAIAQVSSETGELRMLAEEGRL